MKMNIYAFVSGSLMHLKRISILGERCLLLEKNMYFIILKYKPHVQTMNQLIWQHPAGPKKALMLSERSQNLGLHLDCNFT